MNHAAQSPTPDPHAASDALGLWEPKRTLTLEAARRHTRFIHRFRQTLSFLASFLIVILLFQFFTRAKPIKRADDPEQSVKMVSPRYLGRTSDGLPYRVTADSAVRLMDSTEQVELNNPVLYFLRNANAEESIVVAKTGVYNTVSQELNLATDVVLRTDDGYECLTEQATIFAAEKTVTGDSPIDCSGSFGNVSGKAYEILDNYSRFIFKRGTRAYIVPESERTPVIPAPQTVPTDRPDPNQTPDGDTP